MTTYTYNCKFCGEYRIEGDLHDDIPRHGIYYIENGRNRKIGAEEFYSKAPSIAAERKLKGMDEYILVYDHEFSSWQNTNQHSFTPISIKAFYEEYPQDAVDMFNRILMNLGHLITHPSKKFVVEQQDYGNISYFYSSDFESFLEICNQLKELGWIETNSSRDSNITVGVTPQGWLTLRELKPTESSDRVFLAMWFNDNTDNLRKAVKKAVEFAGYKVEEITVDEAQHNDFIMNKVVNMITDAKFVIADLTCLPEKIVKGKVSCGVRGGVYFEAGFARGQGKEVIHTCKKTPESIDRLHFDIHQINTIFGQEDASGVLKSYDSDFIDVLKHRIIATVGKGRHYKE